MTEGREYTIGFDRAAATEQSLVGGKGANLGQLAQAGFNVPPGYTVSTAAYQEFMRTTGLDKLAADYCARFDYSDIDKLEHLTGELRRAITDAEIPTEIAEALAAAHDALGADTYVAVRSSGTAEDLAEASFAGQHDTYLDILGPTAVLDAVKRCWASLWTTRATAYRNKNNIKHGEVAIAVVVQTMVPSEVSGVLFTGNPLTTATDEMVINASWGLGEAIVSGITQPDEYIIDLDTLAVKVKRLGSKEVRVVRDPATGRGTIEEEVPNPEQEQFSLPDADVARLGDLGRRVMEFYGGLPQDIEFAFANGELYLLQSRPITGVAFSWDDHIEAWQRRPDTDVTFTRSFSDELWTGAITPLFYSTRGRAYEKAWSNAMQVAGITEIADHRWFKYYKGTAYYNAYIDVPITTAGFPKAFRPALLTFTAPDAHETVLKAPFSLARFLRWQVRGYALDPAHSVLTYLKKNNARIQGPRSAAEGRPVEELPKLSDRELLRYVQERVDYETQYCLDIVPLMWSFPLVLCSISYMLEHWYRGDNRGIFSELITGVPQRTATVVENLWLWDLAKELRQSEQLREIFEQNTDGAFFAALEEHEEGRAWLGRYQEFLAANYHRGHSDRDIYFPRRSEDPSIDYNALKAFLSADDSHDPEAAEEQANQRRRAAVDDAVASIRKSPLGPVKAEAFKVAHDLAMRLMVFRDDERHFVDRSTMALKRSLLEVNRRLMERGLVEAERDFYFLSQDELFELFQGRASLPLTRAKIAARMANWDAVDGKEVVRPAFLRNYQPLELTSGADDDSSGVLKGLGTSPGTVTGTVRIVKHLKDIGQVQHGEILVCHATDPGWTPVFLVISGVVIETGGLLAHASCLAREYGFPAVQLSGAMSRIPDRAIITINGGTGEVTVLDEAAALQEVSA